MEAGLKGVLPKWGGPERRWSRNWSAENAQANDVQFVSGNLPNSETGRKSAPGSVGALNF